MIYSVSLWFAHSHLDQQPACTLSWLFLNTGLSPSCSSPFTSSACQPLQQTLLLTLVPYLIGSAHSCWSWSRPTLLPRDQQLPSLLLNAASKGQSVTCYSTHILMYPSSHSFLRSMAKAHCFSAWPWSTAAVVLRGTKARIDTRQNTEPKGCYQVSCIQNPHPPPGTA